ncbi:hypothetical protein ARMSODRAFT_560751 [Armillaria solidipes]|uniref:Uncharacterized protein n=1 Tax=Armillaria solidipes TaxID=1076256 RepID=A0A2H3B6W3_9AGAR|nr:hypothetical protein ARMSODRAFT_560751 [Armillaria solidipes]
MFQLVACPTPILSVEMSREIIAFTFQTRITEECSPVRGRERKGMKKGHTTKTVQPRTPSRSTKHCQIHARSNGFFCTSETTMTRPALQDKNWRSCPSSA